MLHDFAPLTPLCRTSCVVTLHQPARQQKSALPAILPFDPLTIGPAGHVGNPALVLQIPGYRLADAGFKSFLRLPAQFTFELSTVHGIAAVMTWAVGDIS